MEANRKTRKWSNNHSAIAIIAIASILSILIPWALTQTRFKPVSFNDTGAIGDTIGGIVGPILNFAGLLVVYFSLREQFNANEEQRKATKQEETYRLQENAFDASLRLVDEIKDHWKNNKKAFRRLLDEEDKLSFYSPDSFADISEADEDGFFWTINQDLKTGILLFNAFIDFIPSLNTQQGKVIITLFRSAYFKPLEDMESYDFHNLALRAEYYQQQYGGIYPHSSPARKEIAYQLKVFKENYARYY